GNEVTIESGSLMTTGGSRPRGKNNLTHHTQGKKKATFIVIPSVRFTKLIIYYLESKHKFHPRPDSLLHLPNEEPGLGYLKFSAKGTKREVFGMPIPNELIAANIQGEQYYKEYLEKLAKHQRYLADEEGSDPDSPAPKPAKATKKSKPSTPKIDLRPPELPLVVEVEAQDEGQARPNPGVLTEGQAGSDPDVSTQLHPEQIDEGFTATAYPNVQENLKLTVKEQVILEEPASSTGTLSSLQHLDKDFSIGDLFFNDKPSEAENDKITTETEDESMVSVKI
nr:E-beta-farnesene synthase [Tanacetum cinerariifolium]